MLQQGFLGSSSTTHVGTGTLIGTRRAERSKQQDALETILFSWMV